MEIEEGVVRLRRMTPPEFNNCFIIQFKILIPS